MTTLIAKLRMVGGALLIVTLATFSHPAIAQQATSVNPTAQSVKEDQLLNELGPSSAFWLSSLFSICGAAWCASKADARAARSFVSTRLNVRCTG